MAAQKATDLRRLLAGVEDVRRSLRARQEELENHLRAAPAENWREAAEKVRYVLSLFSETISSHDSRSQSLIAAVLGDIDRLTKTPNE